MIGSQAYARCPVWLQESLIAARSSVRSLLREGGAYNAFARQVDESQWWSTGRLAAYQARELRAVVTAAARDVPWYRERFGALDLDCEALAFPEAIARLPFTSKADARRAGRALASRSHRWPRFFGSTSGTTGTPLALCQDLRAIQRENAFVERQLAWAGLRRGERRAWMRGDMIVPAAQCEPPYWRLDRGDNLLMLSSYHLSEAAAGAYVEALERFDPVLIQAYPSSIGFLASWMAHARRPMRRGALRGIVTSSETLSEQRRREIELAFGVPVFDWYGQFERVAAIGTCELGGRHLLTDYSYVELLPAGDGLFEIVGTGFNNHAMPLIRYRSGDLVRPAPHGKDCPCGRVFPLVEQVVGRADDEIKLPDGRSIGRLDHIFKGVASVLEAQIRQDQPDVVTMRVVPAPGFDERTRETLVRNARQRLGERIALEVELVGAIPRTGNGKFRNVICNV